MITKDLCTYEIKILRQEKILRDHRLIAPAERAGSPEVP
jgi:hypothetical protein